MRMLCSMSWVFQFVLGYAISQNLGENYVKIAESSKKSITNNRSNCGGGFVSYKNFWVFN